MYRKRKYREKLQDKVLKIIHDNWPIHVREVIKILNWDPMNISNVSKVRYHFKVLEENEKIRTKKIGSALVAWPMDMEKLRVIHELLREE
jgi:predicted transcriptional regulator